MKRKDMLSQFIKKKIFQICDYTFSQKGKNEGRCWFSALEKEPFEICGQKFKSFTWKYMLHPFMFFYKTDDKIRWRNAISLNIHKVCEIESQNTRKNHFSWINNFIQVKKFPG